MADAISSYVANFVRTGDPNSKGLPDWKQCSLASGGSFMRRAPSTSECVVNTPFPDRDKLNRHTALASYNMTEDSLK